MPHLSKTNRLWIIRLILSVLIFCNLSVIFSFSAQTGEVSGKSSGSVVEKIASLFIPHFSEKEPAEREKIVNPLQYPVRKAAHMAEFGCLGGLFFLLLSTFESIGFWICEIAGILFGFCNACADEFHQHFIQGRSSQFTDVLFDTAGAILCCSVLWGITLLIRKKRKDSV